VVYSSSPTSPKCSERSKEFNLNTPDLIILDRDIFTCNVFDIGDTEVLLTLLGGKEVHRASHF